MIHRNLLRISLLVILFVAGCASAYRENSADEVLAEAVPTEAELEDQLTRDQLSEAQLDAFEIRAQQKLRDLIDYLAIAADSSLDSTFRQEAVQQAEALLTPPPMLVRESEARSTAKPLSASPLPDRLVRIPTTAVTALAIQQPLSPEGSGQYRGTLSFSAPAADGDEGTTQHEATMVLQKIEKRFGDEVELVWEVFLEDVQ